jgi:hypothetical protein
MRKKRRTKVLRIIIQILVILVMALYLTQNAY